MKNIFSFSESLISGMLPFVLLIICGIYFTVKSRFYQFRCFNQSFLLFKKAFNTKKKEREFTSFQAACTALSATVGTGNIAGVAGAISIGGAGAVFWMWVSAIFGMCIKSAEIILAVKYRKQKGDGYIGGPMYYIKKALPKGFKILSPLYALVGIISVFCAGNMTQVNAAVLSFCSGMSIRTISGIVFAVLTAVAVIGGVKRIGVLTEKIVPIMSLLYIAMCFGVIFSNFDFLPQAFKMIFKGAFNPRAVTGGAVGALTTVIVTGAARGVFSNEAGLGTSAMAHSAAFDAQAGQQGLYGIFEVFVDTILICTLTALTILCSSVKINYGSYAATELVGDALSLTYGSLALILLSVMMCLFAFSSVIGWAVYGITCTRYIFGEKGGRIFIVIYPIFCIVGAVCDISTVWRAATFFNGMMLCINLPILIMLGDKAIKYMRKRK